MRRFAVDFEKLGAFYLGRPLAADRKQLRPEPLLYDAKDLTTHAVCVGMTGSGKTGLCVTLLEEAAIDGIPALAIDPKGDLGNLGLTFPALRPGDFLPWIDPEEAARKGRTPEEHARATAEFWKKGLAEWGQSGERIRRFRESADVAIYTPGSGAGLGLSVLDSLAAPPPAVADDADALRERVGAAVSGLLALLGLAADPIRSREHILLSNLLHGAWREGRSLDLPALIRAIQSPGFDHVGVFDLESFYPAAERFELAMTLNNLIASPGFATWAQGEPLDIGRLLYTDEGKPRIAILSIAHLSEAERMFFVTVVLNEMVAWMRGQPGTTSLRALLYMDEVFGYFPPTANPPSKTPMLTLLKQARAYGVGVVLATQNPVDLDYKGLSNAGTWFLGRLQTERDKARVIEGLEGASAAAGARFDRAEMERTLAGLRSRVFLMNNVHDEAPELFHTRWALSYLRGPLTRDQIGRLMAARKTRAAGREAAGQTGAPPAAEVPSRRGEGTPRAAAEAQEVSGSTAPASTPAPEAEESRPVLPAGISEAFLPLRPERSATSLRYRPGLLATATLHYASAKVELDVWRAVTLLAPLRVRGPANPWSEAEPLPEPPELEEKPALGARFEKLPAPARSVKSYPLWARKLASHLVRSRPLVLVRCRDLKLVSRPDEGPGEFRARAELVLRESRDRELARLRERSRARIERARDAVQRAARRVGREQEQVSHVRTSTGIAVGAAILSFLSGRRGTSLGRAATAARGASRMAQQRGDVARAREQLHETEEKLARLEEELEAKLADLRDRFDPEALTFDEVRVRPRKSDLEVSGVTLVWMP